MTDIDIDADIDADIDIDADTDTDTDTGQFVTLWFGSQLRNDPAYEWEEGAADWWLQELPQAGGHIVWEQHLPFEIVEVRHQLSHYGDRVIIYLDPASDEGRAEYRRLGGLCLRDQIILARECGLPLRQFAEKKEILPYRLLTYMRQQLEIAEADGEDLTGEVVSGGEHGVDISGLDKAAVLAALWNHALPLGPRPDGDAALMGEAEARGILTQQQGRISDLRGRRLCVVLNGDRFNPWMYDDENMDYDRPDPQQTAQDIVDHLRATGSVSARR